MFWTERIKALKRKYELEGDHNEENEDHDAELKLLELVHLCVDVAN